MLLALADGTAAIAHLPTSDDHPEKQPWPGTIVLATPDELDDEFIMRD